MKYIFGIFIIIFFNACSVKYEINSTSQHNKTDTININHLKKEINNLSKNIDKNEALKVASVAILYSKHLANEYELVTPPLYHNSLIQMGFKKRGLCFHFAEDLIKELKKQELKTLDLHWVVHAKTQYWEHSSIVVSAKGKSIQDGIILDAWRNSGELFWSSFKDDTRYKWIEDNWRSKYNGTIRY